MKHWVDTYPHNIYASVSLLDGKIEGWKVGDQATTPTVYLKKDRFNDYVTKSERWNVNNSEEHNLVFSELAPAWFRQWKLADDYRLIPPYTDVVENSVEPVNNLQQQIKEALAKAEKDGPSLTHQGWIKYLLDELEKASNEINAHQQDDETIFKEVEELAGNVHELIEEVDALKGDMQVLCTEHAAMKEALEWYANERNWGSIEEYGAFVSDGGVKASAVLSTLSQPKEETE